jgi:hypothetical protein
MKQMAKEKYEEASMQTDDKRKKETNRKVDR